MCSRWTMLGKRRFFYFSIYSRICNIYKIYSRVLNGMCLDDRYKMIDTLIRIETRNDKETRRKKYETDQNRRCSGTCVVS